MSSPKFTVIIPTRERFDTLEKCLKTVTNQDYENLEIIVSDNFSNDATEEVVRSESDKRIRYFNTGKRISMSENWEFALSKATGDWVTIIGDDDGLLPNCLEKVSSLVKNTEVDFIMSNYCFFIWPSLKGTRSGYLYVPSRSGCVMRDGSKWLHKVMMGYESYSTLPMLYTGGFASMSAINRWKAHNGKFYHSCTPDVYSAIVFAKTIGKYAYSYEPFAIAGVSGHSNGAGFSSNINREQNPHKMFLEEVNIPFHPHMPMCADGSYPKATYALIYESYLQASNIDDSFKKIDPQEQLTTILATGVFNWNKERSKSVLEWGKIFADMHQLDYDKVKKKAIAKRYLLKLIWLPGGISNVFNYVIPDPDQCLIKDVYQASIVSAAIRADKLPKTGILLEKIRKRLKSGF